MGEQSTMEGGTSMIESSQMSTAEGGGGGTKEKSGLLILLGLCFLVLLVVGVGYTSFSAAPEEITEDNKQDDAAAGQGAAGYSTGGSSSSSPRPAPKTTKAIPTAERPVAPPIKGTSSTTTTRAPYSVKDLYCTVGNRAVMPYMIPPDGICTHLFYSDIVVADGELHGAESDYSWDIFQEVMKNRDTEGGMSFDIRYVDVHEVSYRNVIEAISNLYSNNIRHYGVLTLVTQSKNLATLITKAIDLLTKVKHMHGFDSPARTIIALGLYDYGTANAWTTYETEFKNAVESDRINSVIALSSTGWQESDTECFVSPPSDVDPANKRYPNMKKQASLIARDVVYKHSYVKVGLSFELGTLLYKLADNNTAVQEAAYAKCVHSTVEYRDMPCVEGVQSASAPVATAKFGQLKNKSYVFCFDDQDTLQDKFEILKTTYDLRPGMSWLVKNVHLGAYENCSTDPFEVLKYIKNTLFNMP